MGDSGTKIMQPGAAVPPYELTPEEKEMLGYQAETMRVAMPGIRQYAEEIMPLELGRSKEMYGFTDPILKGGRLPGQYGMIGAPMGEDVYNELFEQRRRPLEARLNELGLLESGVTGELLNKEMIAMKIEDESRRRAELSQLVNLAMGIPMTGMQTAQTASQQATGAISGLGAGQRAYELAAAQARQPRVVGYEPSPWAGVGESVGGLFGQMGTMAMLPYMLGTRKK